MSFPISQVTTAGAYDQYYYFLKKIFSPLMYQKGKNRFLLISLGRAWGGYTTPNKTVAKLISHNSFNMTPQNLKEVIVS